MTVELKEIMEEQAEGDEKRALTELAAKGSTSAGIIEYLGLTKELVK